MKKILVILGTRPDAVKLAPVIARLKDAPEVFETVVVSTAQHGDLLTPVLNLFNIQPDYDLDIMRPSQTPVDVTCRVIQKLTDIYPTERPDCVIVQGDTTSAFAAALAAFHLQIPVAHIEAGLRTGQMYDPFPEEMNRRLISHLASIHFAATSGNRDQLLKENIPSSAIHITGNPVIDALKIIERVKMKDKALSMIFDRIGEGTRVIVLTTHRRENFGEPQKNIFQAVNAVIQEFPDVCVVFPVHPNPEVRRASAEYLVPNARLHCIEPLEYIPFIHLLRRSYLIMTDSGGLQEESPALGKPVVVLRNTTERQELIESGNGVLVSPIRSRIIAAVSELLSDSQRYSTLANRTFLFGNGDASEKIVRVLEQNL